MTRSRGIQKRRKRDPIERFMEKVERLPPDILPTGCWRWTASLNADGYGQFALDGRPVRAHVFAYTYFVGPIPEGLEPDHLCRRRWCCNPEHMEPVTRRENILRGESPIAQVVRTNICVRGHELTPENTIITNRKTGARTCRTCRNERARNDARERWHTDPEFRAQREQARQRYKQRKKERS